MAHCDSNVGSTKSIADGGGIENPPARTTEAKLKIF